MAVMDAERGKLLNCKQLLKHPKYRRKWQILSASKFSRLAQGVDRLIKGTNMISSIQMKDVPKERMKDVTYGQFFCMVWPEKAEQHRAHFVIAGGKINYPGEVATPTAEMLVAKVLFNSVVSTVRKNA